MKKTLLIILFSCSTTQFFHSQTQTLIKENAIIEKDTTKEEKKTSLSKITKKSELKSNTKSVIYKQSVRASYYAEKFHGRLTANGKRFDMNKMTAAHKKLPFGTKVKVTNEANGKSVIVEINDRGPFIKAREIDLSKGAFLAITPSTGIGLLKVTMELIVKK